MLRKKLKKYILCSKYNKDIWGKITTIHKVSNYWKTWIRGIILKMFGKNKWLLENLGKNTIVKNSNFLNFSFEIVKWLKKKKKKQLKLRMRLFFLTKLLRSFYGNLSKKHFLKFCQICLSKKSQAFLYFIWIFELRLPMFIYRSGLVSSLEEASQWVSHGFVSVNNKIFTHLWKPLQLNDYITFDVKLWSKINNFYVKTIFYAFKSLKVHRCKAQNKVNNWKNDSRAHFIAIPNYIFFDSRTMSLYWWKEPSNDQFKYYFSINISNIMKFITI